MEYSTTTDFASPVLCADSETTDLAAGTYYVRFKETATHEASAYTTVEVLPTVAKIGDVCYATLSAAIAAANNGETVEVLATTISEAIDQPTKSITIDGNGATVTGGMILGKDPNESVSLTITGFKFETKGLVVLKVKDLVVDDCTFTNITTALDLTPSSGPESFPEAIVLHYADTVTVTGCTINTTGVNGAGIHVENVDTAVTISGNTIKNTSHNAITVGNATTAEVEITNNTLENWGLADNDGDSVLDGRAIRGQVGDITITGNVMKHTNAPEQFVKLDPVTSFDIDGNYWGSASPDFATIVYNYNLGDIDNYYSDADLTNKVSL